MMRKSVVIGAALVVGGGVWAGPLVGQGALEARGQGGPFLGRSVEIALEHQEELGLTGDQVAKLQEMKGMLDEQIAPLVERIQALRQQLREGEVERAEGLRQMEALRGELITAGAPLQGRVQELFTVAQHRQLQALLRADRPGRARGAGGMGWGAGELGRGAGWMSRGAGGMGRGAGWMAPGPLGGPRGGMGMRPGVGAGLRRALPGRGPGLAHRLGARLRWGIGG
jgi:hypothetical protein